MYATDLVAGLLTRTSPNVWFCLPAGTIALARPPSGHNVLLNSLLNPLLNSLLNIFSSFNLIYAVNIRILPQGSKPFRISRCEPRAVHEIYILRCEEGWLARGRG